MGPTEIRAYQLHLTQDRQLSPSSISVAVAALRFLYKVTLKRGWNLDDVIPTGPAGRRTLPVVLSPEEVAGFLDAVDSLKHRTILTVCYAAGLRVSEAVRLKPTAIDSQRMVIRVEQGKGHKDRYVMLSPKLLEMLRDYWQARPPEGSGCFRATCPASRSRRCRRRHLPERPAPVRHHQADHAAFAAPRLRRPSAGSRHRRAHDPAAARSSQPDHHGALSADRDQQGLRDHQPAGRAAAGLTIRAGASRPPDAPGSWPAGPWRWRTSSAAIGAGLSGSSTARRCPPRSAAP